MESIRAHNFISTHGLLRPSCADCSLKGFCLPTAMDVLDIDKLDNIIRHSKSIPMGKHLHRDGQIFSSLYAVRSGSIKTYWIDDDGFEHVTGFYLPGELLGFEGIDSKNHGCNIITLETTTVCEIPFKHLEDLACTVPRLQHHLFQLMSRKIITNHAMLRTLCKKNAIGKVATFLVSLSKRYSQGRYSQGLLQLPMSRIDIGNFLGLTIETVSRAFSYLHKANIITVDGRKIIINDYDELEFQSQSKT